MMIAVETEIEEIVPEIEEVVPDRRRKLTKSLYRCCYYIYLCNHI